MSISQYVYNKGREGSFEWWHHRISSTDSKVRDTLQDSIKHSGSERVKAWTRTGRLPFPLKREQHNEKTALDFTKVDFKSDKIFHLTLGSDKSLLWISTVVRSLNFSLHTCFPFLLTVISNFQKLEKQRRRCYDELRERIEREKKIRKISEELELQKNLMVCNTGEG